MVTDDPETPGDGNWEINVAFTFERLPSSTSSETPLLDINYGIGDRIQLKYELPWLNGHDPTAGSSSAVGNSLVGVKWRFFDAGQDGWHVSAYPQLSFRTPWTSAEYSDLTELAGAMLLPLEVMRTFALCSVNFDVGRRLAPAGDGGWFGGVVVGHEVGQRLEWMAEFHGDFSTDLGQSALQSNLGLRWSATKRDSLLLEFGRSFHSGFTPGVNLHGYLGWQLRR
jgi:hypothetical protein